MLGGRLNPTESVGCGLLYFLDPLGDKPHESDGVIDAKLVEISYGEQTGKYTFLFENEQESPDAS